MSDIDPSSSKENPTDRFRKMLADPGNDEELSEQELVGSGLLERHPTGYPDSTGGWYTEGDEENDAEEVKSGEETTSGIETTQNEEPIVEEGSAGETPPAGLAVSPIPPPPLIKATPTSSPPAVGTYGLPLPRRVNEIDVDATRVSPPAYPPRINRTTNRTTTPSPLPTHPIRPSSRSPVPPDSTRKSFSWEKGLGCVLRAFVFILFATVLISLCGASFILYQYYSIARGLPDVEDLRQRASTFETTRILDRTGDILYEILDPNAGRRTYVTLDKISPYLVAATIATEDKAFYTHPGFDVTAILRAFLQNYISGGTVSGASTITQQLARNLLFTPEERSNQSYERKMREAVLAAEITRRYTKDEILELYLNESYYSNLAYGVEAAAETYFHTSAEKLSLAQAAFLAGLPQAPSVYDVYDNHDATIQRMENVLVLMYRASQEQNCIYVSNNPQRVCVDAVVAATAAEELRNYEFPSPDVPIKYPHWVNYIRLLLEQQYDPQTIYRSGFSVYTTLDPTLQDLGTQLVKNQVNDVAVEHHVTDGAMVAIRPATGEILAMVGSADFSNEAISGQVNMAISPRQPGSAIKPLTYLTAFEKGWTASTLIWDVPSEFPPSGIASDPSPPYKPVNYDEKFHGPVTVRTALANSYNIPAVKTLNFVGIYDDPNTPGEDGLVAMAKRLGITTLTRTDYGLSLTLGGGEVSLLELTGVYAVIANEGRRVPPVAITRILDHEGNIVYEAPPNQAQQLLRPEHAFIISSILSDNQARIPEFGANSVLNLPFQVAAKTGTTNDFRDNWTLGYTPDLAVGVWVGNADYSPMQDISGITGAAPVWSEFMKISVPQVSGGNPTPFSRPAGIVDKVICAISGTEPSEWCPQQRTEIFAADQPPLPKADDLWQKIEVDTWTGLKASSSCDDFKAEEFVLNVTDSWAVKWIKNDSQGKDWAAGIGFKKPFLFTPSRECKNDDPRPLLQFLAPSDGSTIVQNPVDIFARADATKNFDYFQLEYGVGDEPVKWEILLKNKKPYNDSNKLFSWDALDIPPGAVTLKLYLHSKEDTFAELKIHITLQVPTPTPTPTDTLTPTGTSEPTSTPTFTPTQTQTPTMTSTPTNTMTPTLTATSSP
jgi:penicillin-binding protein 1C